MKSHIERIKKALAKENAPALTSRMVKIMDGRLWGYGGQFCLSVPYASELECGFLPEPVFQFYSLERENEVLVLQAGKLCITAGNRTIKVPCLPSVDIPILDVVGVPTPCVLNVENLKRAVNFINPQEQRGNFSGVVFRNGSCLAGCGLWFFLGSSGLPESVDLMIPPDAVKAILSIKSPTTAFSLDQSGLRFDFEDGTRLTSRIIADTFPQVEKLFAGEKGWFDLAPDVVKEIQNTKCDAWTTEGMDLVHKSGDTEGRIISGLGEQDGIEFHISHNGFSHLLDLTGKFCLKETAMAVFGENFAALAALQRK